MRSVYRTNITRIRIVTPRKIATDLAVKMLFNPSAGQRSTATDPAYRGAAMKNAIKTALASRAMRTAGPPSQPHACWTTPRITAADNSAHPAMNFAFVERNSFRFLRSRASTLAAQRNEFRSTTTSVAVSESRSVFCDRGRALWPLNGMNSVLRPRRWPSPNHATPSKCYSLALGTGQPHLMPDGKAPAPLLVYG
jgi:hypothetical protein